jgi:hypothetical protein
MSDVTQPRMARGRALPAGVLAAALFTLLALAPFASAAPDPVAGGTTTLTLNSNFSTTLQKNGVKLSKIGPATARGKSLSLPVSGGTLDPLTGLGTLTHSGGFKLKVGRKSIALRSLELNTTSRSLSARVGSRRLKVASVKRFTFAREGFGVNLKITKLMLTGEAARELNKALAVPVEKKSTMDKAAIGKSKATAKVKPIFKGSQILASVSSTTQPSTVTVAPGGSAALATSLPTAQKLAELNVGIETVAPSTMASPGPPPAFDFPIGGGTISPSGTAGIVQTVGGLKLVQDGDRFPAPLGLAGKTSTIALNTIYVALGAKIATVEVVLSSTISAEANRGALGRGSIADVRLTGATISADPVTHTVSVQNASATLQAPTAEVLNSVFGGPFVAAKLPHPTFAAGEPLGTFSFTAQTE